MICRNINKEYICYSVTIIKKVSRNFRKELFKRKFMKKAITFFTLLMGVIIYSQELKVKKEQILLDSNPIAKLEKTKVFIFF
jgi:hypothetical protein